MAANLELVIKAVDHASGVLDNVEKKTDSLGSKLGTGLKVAGAAAAAGVGLAVVAGIDFVKAAIEEEEMIGRLDQALSNVGVSYKDNEGAIEGVIKQREKLAFSDDQLRESLALLVAQTGNLDEAFKRQQIAMDLARGTGLDLQTASRLLGKVTDENRNVLGRYGISVEHASTAQEVLAAVQAKFGGQAERFGQTATAKWQRFGIALQNVKETIGAALLPIVTRLGEKLAIFLEEHQADIERFVKDFQDFANSEALPFLERAFGHLRDIIEAVINTGIVQWLSEHREVALALALVLGVLLIAFAGPIVTILALIAVGTLLLGNWDAIRAKAEELYATVKAKIEGIINSVKEIPIIGVIFQAAFDYIWRLVQLYWDLYKVYIETIINVIKAIVEIVLGLIHGDFDRVWNGIKMLVESILTGLKDSVFILLSGMKDLAIIILGAMVGVYADLFTQAKNAAFNAISGLPGLVQGALLSVVLAIMNLFDEFRRVGEKVIDYLIRGIKDGIGKIGSVIKDIIDKINPLNWDIPFGSPFLSAFEHAGQRAVKSLQRGLSTLPDISIPLELNPGRSLAGGAIQAPTMGGGTNVYITAPFQPTFTTATPAEAEQFMEWVHAGLAKRLGHGF